MGSILKKAGANQYREVFIKKGSHEPSSNIKRGSTEPLSAESLIFFFKIHFSRIKQIFTLPENFLLGMCRVYNTCHEFVTRAVKNTTDIEK